MDQTTPLDEGLGEGPGEALAHELQTLITAEVANAMGLWREGAPARLLARLIHRLASRFAQLAAAFDADVATVGFRAATSRFASHFIEGSKIFGAQVVPTEGPLLVAANHPGVSDALVIVSNLPRDDVKLVISDVPLTRALPHAGRHFIFVSGDAMDRVQATRQILRHLEGGGAAVIFPSTQLTPDPAICGQTSPRGERLQGGFVRGGADHGIRALIDATFGPWSRSVLLPLRRVPGCRITLAIVSDVLVPRFVKHPVVRLVPNPRGWEHLRTAEILQALAQLRQGDRFGLVPRVTFGTPVGLTELDRGVDGRMDTTAAMATLIELGSALLKAHIAHAKERERETL